MPRAVVVAAGALDSLPAEVQDVANILSAAGWTVRLCFGDDATRAGLTRAAGEGFAELAWLGTHANAAGFGLADGVLSATDLGMWLAQIGAQECVLNACYSIEHVTAIQRVAPVGVACTIDATGVDDRLAWTMGVAIARARVRTGDMTRAVAEATGNGAVGYRYIPYAGRGAGSGGRMSNEDQDLLRQLVTAIKGDGMTGLGLIAQWRQLAGSLDVFMAEERTARQEQEHLNQEYDARLRALENAKPVAMTERSAYIAVVTVAVVAVLLLVAVIVLNGGLH